MVASAAIVSADSVLRATLLDLCDLHSKGVHQDDDVEVKALRVARQISMPHWLLSPLALEKEASLNPTRSHSCTGKHWNMMPSDGCS
eukprot:6492080-Amphidinium_carterae.1